MASAQLRRLEQRLEAIPQSIKDAVKPTLEKAGDELATSMKHLAPKDSGDLIESITVTHAGDSTPAYSQPGGSTVVPENAVLVTVGNVNVRYPHLVEYGTATTGAQPFFWPAFRLARKRLEGRIKRAISKAIKEGFGS